MDKIFILVSDLAQALIYLHVVLIIVQSLPCKRRSDAQMKDYITAFREIRQLFDYVFVIKFERHPSE